MPQNAIQFQPGQPLAEFFSLYGTEAQCEAALERRRWPAGFEIVARPRNRRSNCHLSPSQPRGRPLCLVLQSLLPGIWAAAPGRIPPAGAAVRPPTLAEHPRRAPTSCAALTRSPNCGGRSPCHRGPSR